MDSEVKLLREYQLGYIFLHPVSLTPAAECSYSERLIQYGCPPVVNFPVSRRGIVCLQFEVCHQRSSHPVVPAPIPSGNPAPLPFSSRPALPDCSIPSHRGFQSGPATRSEVVQSVSSSSPSVLVVQDSDISQILSNPKSDANQERRLKNVQNVLASKNCPNVCH